MDESRRDCFTDGQTEKLEKPEEGTAHVCRV